jgi:AAA family ATP:ADP antiporter
VTLLSIQKGERRDTWAAFWTLFVLIASHSLLETARDALFLGRVPAARLPWVYLAIAFLSVLAVKLQLWLRLHLNPRQALSSICVLAGLVTFGFFALYRQLGVFSVYALYCWSGLLATSLLTYFWALIGGAFTIRQAKRLYGIIGAGSVLGAITGSGVASVLARSLPAELLLCVSAAGFLVTAGAPWLFRSDSLPDESERAAATPKLRATLAYVLEEPYGFRIALSLFLASSCLTIADFVFKSSVAILVPKNELAPFLGAVYFVVNVLSLVCQVGLVALLLRRVSIGAALSILPLLLAGAGLGMVAFGGLVSVLAVKAADGALRYSLHRTATELLFLPLAEETRRRVKGFMDAAGQRGGQVLGSLAILGVTAASASPRSMALVLVLFAGAWAASAIALRRPYIELFRTRLQSARMAHLEEFPELDVASLETLIAALESDDDAEVLAALKILEHEERSRFIPALILHHPSEQVVLRALAILTHSQRKNLDKVLARVIDHPSPLVRAASIAAYSVLAPDAAKLHERLKLESSPEVQAAICANLIAAGEFSDAERAERLTALLQDGSPATKIALADAIQLRGASGFLDTLLELNDSKEVEVRCAALTAMNHVFPVSDDAQGKIVLTTLVRALVDEPTRALAMQLLSGRGAPAFSELRARFEDISCDARLRWRLPRAMSECNAGSAARALAAWLPQEKNGSVRYQVIRELERLLRRDPKLRIDKQALEQALEESVSRAFICLDRRLSLLEGAAADARRITPGHELLVALLRDKESNARGRLFRMLGVLHPAEDFAQIYRGLAASKELRATSLELIDSIISEPLRTSVLALVDDGDDELRLARAGRYHQPLRLEYDVLVARLTRSNSEAVREVARFHVRELGLNDSALNDGEAA